MVKCNNVLLFKSPVHTRGYIPTIFILASSILGGLAGSTFDSLLGATVQGIYYCFLCQKETEASVHRCGQPAQHLRGWRWLNNDVVNFASSIVGSLIAGLFGWLVL